MCSITPGADDVDARERQRDLRRLVQHLCGQAGHLLRRGALGAQGDVDGVVQVVGDLVEVAVLDAAVQAGRVDVDDEAGPSFIVTANGWAPPMPPQPAVRVSVPASVPPYRFSATAANAAGSATARSASDLRSSSIPAPFRPCMNWLYERPFTRAAASILTIQRERKFRFLTRRSRYA